MEWLRGTLDLGSDVGDFRTGHRLDWDEHLPFVMLVYRSIVHESTGYMPDGVLPRGDPAIGRELTLLVDLIWIAATN